MQHLVRIVGLMVAMSPSFVAIQSSAADPKWYSCIARAASHTGRYTFQIAINPCRVYWREIDVHLKIRDCQPPQIAALKPSATDNHSVVWFDLKTGEFYDYLSGVRDHGTCKQLSGEPVR